MARIKRCIVLICIAVCCLALLAACGGGAKNQAPAPAAGGAPLVFVGADQTNWDKALGIGDYSYYIALVLNDDGTVTMNATCAGAGPSGEPQSTEDFSVNDFTQTGSWTKEEGYGYTITLGDYTTKTDYDRASARQYIYIEIKNGDASSGLVLLMAKDISFRTEIAADYDIFEARDAQYVFSANGTSGNGNATQTKIYLEKDGAANLASQMGASGSYSRGTWSENADKTLTVKLGAAEYIADYCDIAGKEGYRLNYNSSSMYASATGADVAYTDKDFDGETIRTLSCGERDYTVELTEKGIAAVYNSANVRVASGRYTEESGVLSIMLAGNTYVSDAEGNITLSFTVVSSGGGPFRRSTTVERSFPIDGSLPPEIASGEASGETASGEANASAEADASGEAGAPAEAGASGEADASAEAGAPAETDAPAEAGASGEPGASGEADASQG